MENPLQHQNIRPGLMIADHKIPAVRLEIVYAVDMPFRVIEEPLVAIVHRYPACGDPVDEPIEKAAEYRSGDKGFKKGDKEQQRHPEKGVDDVKQKRNAALYWRW